MAKIAAADQMFNEHFSQIYGERWPLLSQAMLQKSIKVAHAPMGSAPKDGLHPIENMPEGFYWIDDPQQYSLLRAEQREGKNRYYLMDYASALCAMALPIVPGDRVLDMCAAPGGKSLVLARSIGEENDLVCNEFSKTRLGRLRQVLNEHLPAQTLQRIRTTGSDASLIGVKFPEAFDKVLLDAPCSGEKHLLEDPKEMQQWSPKRSQRLAARQYSMLCSALLTLKPKGQMVYSTCSISPVENDLVVQKLLDKKGDKIALDIEGLNLPDFVTRTEVGFSIFPDSAHGHGPIYFTRLKKI